MKIENCFVLKQRNKRNKKYITRLLKLAVDMGTLPNTSICLSLRHSNYKIKTKQNMQLLVTGLKPRRQGKLQIKFVKRQHLSWLISQNIRDHWIKK